MTIDRDEKRNALSVEVARGLRHAIESSFAHSRAIVLTGAGKAFSAGADLGENKLGAGSSRRSQSCSTRCVRHLCLSSRM
ncbi:MULTISPECIES: enoyl-CoA hydratase/isomerase family protein [unclassified Corynebacterium]|uniref:enoyl-CoA hydratase/isomerase family protein n=1 Tax=unclassified Corynebacterium TaxID=2624378 RepID=UPI0021AAAEEC|nr:MULTISPECIES: enoyl-CoA hydratase-related protein [unclassified Corynebacterium]